MEILETVYAEALPGEDRLERFQRLAKMQISRSASFERWANGRGLSDDDKEIAKDGWSAAWESMRVDASFDVLRRLAVFDESFRLPSLNAGTDEFKGNVEQKFAKLMLAVSILALTIQRDHEKNEGATENED